MKVNERSESAIKKKTSVNAKGNSSSRKVNIIVKTIYFFKQLIFELRWFESAMYATRQLKKL